MCIKYPRMEAWERKGEWDCDQMKEEVSGETREGFCTD